MPWVQNADEARRAVAATRYPPQGIRGYAVTTRAISNGRVKDYAKRVHDELYVIVQVDLGGARHSRSDPSKWTASMVCSSDRAIWPQTSGTSATARIPIVGWIRDATQNCATGLYFLAACAVASAAIAFFAVRPAADPVVAPARVKAV